MFASDYIELLGIVDPSDFVQNLDIFLAQREGLAFESAIESMRGSEMSST